MGSHEPRRRENKLRGKVSGPWQLEAPVEVTWHWEPSWGGWVRQPHQVPHCLRETGSTPTAALGARWQEFTMRLSLQLECCCDYTSEEQCEHSTTKLQVCTLRIK